MKRIFLVCSLLTVGLSELVFHKAHTQVIWEPNVPPNEKNFPVIWGTKSQPYKLKNSQSVWEIIPEPKSQVNPSTVIIWEVLSPEDMPIIPPSKKKSNTEFLPPSNLEEAHTLINAIPLQSSDFKPLLNLSHTVPTASVLSQEEWRLIASTISPFKYANGTGNQNYAIRLDYGLNEKLQISWFYSEADDPLNAEITGLNIRPGNYWQVYGAAARLKFLSGKNVSLAVNGSLESWTVGSGGSDSRGQNSDSGASPNIFNDSGERVETQNFIGSVSIPLTWDANKKWQFTFNPGVSFLPPNQGKDQGGAGKFYGTNIYISGGLLWQPLPQVGVTASIAQPLGSGSNSFNKDLKYSRAPIFSGGLSWHLNPRIALQANLTNGFGLTPATSILTLPSDNRLGYSTSFVFTADAADTPQPELSPIQRSLSQNGLTVSTALVPPDKTILAKVSADIEGNLNTIFGVSISNIFHLDFYRSENKNIPDTTVQARTYENNNSVNWRGSGKAVLTSPLRDSPIWSALRISFGRNVDAVDNSADGYLFAETPLTWEANSKVALNVSPKFAWTGVGNLWGIGIGANIKIAPKWELIPETNFILNSQQENNNTIGLRWNASDDISVEIYGSTASSIIDIGQLINAEKIRWGSRLVIRL